MPLKHSASTAPLKASILLSAESSAAIPGEAMATILCPSLFLPFLHVRDLYIVYIQWFTENRLRQMEQAIFCKLLIYRLLCGGLPCQADEDAEREILAVGVAQDEFSEVKGLVCVLKAECLLHDCFSENCRVSV